LRTLDEKTATIYKQNLKILMLNKKPQHAPGKPVKKEDAGEEEEVTEEVEISKIKVINKKKKNNAKGKR
jgi:hypothetical protein